MVLPSSITKVRNLLASARLPYLRSSGLVPPDADLSWIHSQPSRERVTVTGLNDGSNRIFQVPAGGDYEWYVGGRLQDPQGDYIWLSPTTVQFVVAPPAGDEGKVAAYQVNLPVVEQGTVAGSYYGDLEGTVDGENDTFLIPAAGFVHVQIQMDGFVLAEGVDYTRSGATVVFGPEWIPYEGRKVKVRTWR